MSLTKATLQNLDSKDKFECLFNPTEYTVAKNNSWQAKKVVGKNVPQLDFTGGQSKTLKMKLFFDVAEQDDADVRTSVDKLWNLVMIDETRKNPKTQKARPPLCLFQWGPNWEFTAAITALSVNYTLFKEDGTPVRATADATFQEAEDSSAKKGTNPTSYSEPGHRRRVVRPRDTLAIIAFEEYGDSGQWRLIAQANQMDDPMALSPGQVLAIPPARG
jgi:nucleoid-associated protein YgaU